MTNVRYPYALPLSSPPPIPKPSLRPTPITEADEDKTHPKTTNDQEHEEIEHEKILQSLKPLEDEHFFFFEVLVDSLEMLVEESRKSDEEVLPLNVSIKYESLPNMVINQEAFTTQDGEDLVTGKVVSEGESPSSEEVKQDKAIHWNTKCGISSLFPLSPLSLIKLLQRNYMEVIVYRSNTDTTIGRTEFRLDEDFCRCVLQAADMQFASTLPKSLIKQDEHTLKNDKNVDTVKISLTVRLACFGSVIMTRCERMESSYTYIFKNSPIIESFKCQQYNFQNQSKTIFTKDTKNKCNCLKKNPEFICPEPSEIIEENICLCSCSENENQENSGTDSKLKKCPFQFNCPLSKSKGHKMIK